jgi:PD-(D/E)XK nuclease superfamily
MGDHRAASVQGFESFFHRLAEYLPALQASRRQQELLLAPHYNIFRVLPIERRETVLHSPMLAHLLDPTASHGQGYLFLRAFFQVAHANARLSPPAEPLDASEWSVRPEVFIGNGSIDLLIECPKQKYVLVIENKIDAAEQDTQLSRYYQWLEERRADYATRQLVFLTPTGRDSDSKKAVRYVRMSYHKDILEFLKRTIPNIQPPHVKELVGQYQAILNDWAQEATDEKYSP